MVIFNSYVKLPEGNYVYISFNREALKMNRSNILNYGISSGKYSTLAWDYILYDFQLSPRPASTALSKRGVVKKVSLDALPSRSREILQMGPLGLKGLKGPEVDDPLPAIHHAALAKNIDHGHWP